MSSHSDISSKLTADSAPSSFFARHGAQPLPSLSGGVVSEEHAILEPYRYTCAVAGKGMRSKIIEVFNYWLSVSDVCRTQTAAIVEKLHNASLIIDDIEDSSLQRRGRPVAHAVFGEAASINCANFIYFEAFHDAVCLGKPAVVPALLDELMKLHLGQGLDIYYRDNGMCPSEAQYCEMVQHKTAGLFRLGITLLQSFSDDKRDFIPLCNDLGLYYQVMDDVLNLKSAEMFGHKSFCEDLTEGKFSFPIVHHVLASPGDTRVLNIMRKKTTDATLKQFAVRCLEETQSFIYALKFSEAVADRIRQRCSEFGGNATLLALLQHWQDRMRAACTSELPQPPSS